jgi:EAL domain-containing protein (putative c-di-GMP-specific phosphodiesterase class I)
LINAEGHALGVLCVIDQVPRELAAEHEAALRTLSRHAMAQLELRRQLSLFICGGKANQGHYSALRHAARAGEFVVRYQPKVDLGSGRVVGLEALLRWDRPGHGLVMPSEFIPLLEESGLILEVGAWVLQQTADRYSDWRRKGIDTPRIAVNVSPCQIRQSDFLDVFERAIAADPRDGGGLDIEITEGVLMENTEDIIRKLRLIRDKGVRIAIDDFGTGYSSLRYLSGLPIDTLKVDTSFIAAMTESAEGMAIVSTIIALAHVLKLTVVAEGVETQEQRKLLRLLRCDQIQGYIFSEPLTSRETENLLTGVSPLERVELSARSAGS